MMVLCTITEVIVFSMVRFKVNWRRKRLITWFYEVNISCEFVRIGTKIKLYFPAIGKKYKIITSEKYDSQFTSTTKNPIHAFLSTRTGQRVPISPISWVSVF